MGEIGAIRRYAYWSERAVREIADDNNIDLSRRWLFRIRTPAFGLLPQAVLDEEHKALQRHEVALKIEKSIGQLAVEDFVTPPRAAFAKGSGDITFAAYTHPYRGKKKSDGKGVIVHTRTQSSSGCRIEVCLFGSLENCAGYLSGSQAQTAKWSRSSTRSIREFITGRGRSKAPIYDDDESIAVEVLRVFKSHGMLDRHVFRRITSAEWFAELYHDVELDKNRWNLRPGQDIPEPVDRIVIGRPLWVRSHSGQ